MKQRVIPRDATVAELERKAHDAEKESANEPEPRATELRELAKLYREMVRFGACSEGYKRWVYAEPSQPSRIAPLRLKPDFEAKIDIRLEPSTDPADVNCWGGSY